MILFSFRHSFYQTDSAVTIQIPIKGLKKEQVEVQTTDTTVCRFYFQDNFY
jgi:HSP20 family molecular chaperone IbpA